MRGLPAEPRADLAERIRAFPFFVNNLYPGLRTGWIRLSARITVGMFLSDAPRRLRPQDSVPEGLDAAVMPAGVVLNSEGILLGAIHEPQPGKRAADVMNPAPQTIRPDMTLKLAAALLRNNRYLLITEADGRYSGLYRYALPARL